MKIIETLNWSVNYLREKNIEEARNDAQLLLSHILNKRKFEIYLNSEKETDKKSFSKFKESVIKRAKKIPLAYIIGEVEFMGLKFFVDENVFIPRPETEILVETAIKQVAGGRWQASEKRLEPVTCNLKPVIIDLGTGCGNIAISLTKYIKNCKIYAVEINEEAIKIAKKNSRFHNVNKKIKFIRGNFYSPLENLNLYGKIDIIVSNPPYIEESEMEHLQDEVKKEPPISINGGNDGLKFYPIIISNGIKYLKNGGYLIVEIGYNQKNSVIQMFKKEGRFKNCRIIKDYFGIDRIVLAQKKFQ